MWVLCCWFGGEQENRQAPQLNEQLREELEKDDQEAEGHHGGSGGRSDPGDHAGAGYGDRFQPAGGRQIPRKRHRTRQLLPPHPHPPPTPTPTPEVVEEVSGDYILPQSSVQYITNADLAGLSEWEIRVARNEIYARHGRIFTSPDLAEYFSQKSWYVPSIPADQFDNSYLNSIEIANLQVITQYEADHNLNQ